MKPGLFKSASSAGRPKAGQSNVRGKLISGPIPIPDPAEDDEFPMRQPGTGLATPLGHEGRSKMLVTPEGSSALEPTIETGATPDVPESANPEPRTGPSQASEASGSLAQRRANRSSTLRYSTISTTDTDQSRNSPQRKKSTLRTTLSRLFGRKKKRGSNEGLETHPEHPMGSPQHRSDPSAMNRTFAKEGEPKRSASLPITEFDRALRSHSVGPDDIIAIESARNSLNGEPLRYRRRAATISSKLYVRKSRDFGDLSGLSPRPASAHGRSSSDGLGQDDPENIGRAITSDILWQHRRSRSLSQLKDEGTTKRKRSDEIRYWRESYDPGFQSPTSSNVNENEDTGNITFDPPDETSVDVKPKTPPQPFNFGPMVGMKITQAASIEERIVTLETRNQKLEKLVAQLFELVAGANNDADMPERNPPPIPQAPSVVYTSSTMAKPALYQTATNETLSSSRYSVSRHSNESFGDGHTFIGSLPTSTRPMNRPTSTATVRGATSLPTFPREGSESFNADQYTTLMALLETERAARQVLEAQVTKLRHEVNLMSRTSHKFDALRGPFNTTYSTFEHDDDEDDIQVITGEEDLSESEAFKTPREEYPQHGFGAFGEELIDEDVDSSRKKAARTLSLSQLTLGKPKKPQTEAGVQL
ncbi:hypothetical protein JX266_006652 [Neoarthrinium moseri]|nr:hypothetical protein JX266_006652 [Neoarthrinium moseri]